MKFKETQALSGVNILANDHYVSIPYDCSDVADESGVIKAGTIIPTNDENAIGVLLYDVVKDDNPNGAVVIHGFIDKNKLSVKPEATAITALKGIMFLPFGGDD